VRGGFHILILVVSLIAPQLAMEYSHFEAQEYKGISATIKCDPVAKN
jgi:hypothetical protein